MPKGEHFKKPNPRNTQVSFKVNEAEWSTLQQLANERGMSIPQWLRLQITETNPPQNIPSNNLPPSNVTGKEQQMTLF